MAIFQRYIMSALMDTKARDARGASVSCIMAPAAFCADRATSDEIRHKAKNGSFSTTAACNVLNERIRCNGYHSRINSTTGRLTAIGLLNRANTVKKP